VRSRNGASVSVGVMRDKKEQNLNLTLPSRKESGELQEEESWEGPLFDADSGVELSELQQELAQLQPKMELATEEARTSVEALRTESCAQQKKIRQQGEKLKLHSHLQQERLKKDQERMKIRLERQRHSFDI
jgi:hypothetical protein